MAQGTPEEPEPVGDLRAAVPARRRRPRWLRLSVMVALTLAAVVYGVLPSLLAAKSDIDLIRTASLYYLAGAFLLEAASLVAYTGLTRAVLPPLSRVGWPTQLGIDLTGFGVSHVLPGGGATAMGLRYRMMTQAGIAPATVVTTTATQTVLSDVALAACYLVGAAASVPSVIAHRPLEITAAIGVALVAGVVAAGALLVRGESALIDRLRAAESRVAGWLRPRLEHVGQELTTFLRSGSRTASAAGFAMGNWLLDAACLYVCLSSFQGDHIDPALVLTAYGFANLLGLLPLTPGGLGVIEGSLIPLLIALGTSSPVAVLGVLTWRVLQFWLPVPVAAGCYIALRVSGRLNVPPLTRVREITGPPPEAGEP